LLTWILSFIISLPGFDGDLLRLFIKDAVAGVAGVVALDHDDGNRGDSRHRDDDDNSGGGKGDDDKGGGYTRFGYKHADGAAWVDEEGVRKGGAEVADAVVPELCSQG